MNELPFSIWVLHANYNSHEQGTVVCLAITVGAVAGWACPFSLARLAMQTTG